MSRSGAELGGEGSGEGWREQGWGPLGRKMINPEQSLFFSRPGWSSSAAGCDRHRSAAKKWTRETLRQQGCAAVRTNKSFSVRGSAVFGISRAFAYPSGEY